MNGCGNECLLGQTTPLPSIFLAAYIYLSFPSAQICMLFVLAEQILIMLLGSTEDSLFPEAFLDHSEFH